MKKKLDVEQLVSNAIRASEALGLPSPRLQFTWVSLNDEWSKKVCEYSLILPLRQLDIRRESGDDRNFRREWPAQIGRTVSEGGRYPVHAGEVSSPFRDGAHAHWDSELLSLPVYAVCEENFTRLQKKGAA